MERVRFILYKGKKILYKDFSNCTVDETLEVIKEVKKVIASQPKESVLTLTNVSNARYNLNIINKLKQLLIDNKNFVKKGAVIGLGSRQKIMYNTLMTASHRHLPVFPNEEEAKRWLIEKRRFQRLLDKIAVEYYIIEQKSYFKKSFTNDISLGGLSLIVNEELKKGTFLFLHIHLPDGRYPIDVKGKVIWRQEQLGDKNKKEYRLGTSFVEISTNSRQRLFEYIFERLKEK